MTQSPVLPGHRTPDRADKAASTLTGAALTERIRANVANPATSDEFDANAALDDLLGVVGLSSADGGGVVEFLGADPVIPSPLRLGGVAAIALAAKSVAIAAMNRDRGGEGQDIRVDIRRTPHRLCPFYDRRWELIGSYPPAMSMLPGLGAEPYQTRDGRWIMPLNPYPKLRYNAETVLGAPQSGVAAAIALRDAEELEQAGSDAGVVMPLVRTTDEWLATAQHAAAAESPLITLKRIGDAPIEPLAPLSEGELPLSGVRALGMSHVIAGPGTGRALALHGADVLNIWVRPRTRRTSSTTPPMWARDRASSIPTSRKGSSFSALFSPKPTCSTRTAARGIWTRWA
jgi:crotonobetainyl-CoA:carnitine CoA-transferase CaiB-like acyl-CoA transferase